MNYPLERRCVDMLRMILFSSGPISVAALTDQLGISRRSAYYDLEKIDAWLTAQKLSPLVRDRGKGISVTPEQSRQIQQLLFQSEDNTLRVFSPVERERLILCMVVLSTRPVFTEDFMNWCLVSRNTAVNDLKNVSAFLKRSKLSLRYFAREGYRIQGNQIHARALFCLYYPQFMDYIQGNICTPEQRRLMDESHLRFKAIEQALNTEYVTGILPALAALTYSIAGHRQLHSSSQSVLLPLTSADRKRVSGTEEYRLICQHFPELAAEERLYLALHLLGSRLQVNSIVLEDGAEQAEEIAQRLVDSFEEITGIPCGDNRELIDALTAHLKTSLYRYRYGIQMGNPMLEQIRSQYRELFELTKAAFSALAMRWGCTSPTLRSPISPCILEAVWAPSEGTTSPCES